MMEELSNYLGGNLTSWIIDFLQPWHDYMGWLFALFIVMSVTGLIYAQSRRV